MIAGRAGPFVQHRAVLTRIRILPGPGEVCLEVGDRVTSDTVVARAPGRGRLHTVNAARQLDVLPGEVPGAMASAVGDDVEVGQVLARTRGLFGLFTAACRAPVAGKLAAVSEHTGRILLEEPAEPVEMRAFLPGIVASVHAERGATVTGWGARVAGVFGVGAERCGPLLPVVGRADVTVEASQIGSDVEGRVLLGGALITADALRRAADLGVAGVITGGVHDSELADWLGRATVLADTTTVRASLTLVVTGGFGRVPMDPEAFDLMKGHAGHMVCVTGATRVRAGAVRPEVIVPLDDPSENCRPDSVPALAVGSRVLVVRAPWSHHRGRVGRLPAGPVTVESGARCLAAEVDLESGSTVVVPRCNLEVLEGP